MDGTNNTPQITARGRGRPPGSLNVVTATVRAAIADAVSGYLTTDRLAADLADLDPKDRVAAIIHLASYIIPKPQSIAVGIADSQRDTLTDRLILLATPPDDE